MLQQRVHTCDVVIGELLVGTGLPKTFAADLKALPRIPNPGPREMLSFVERHPKVIGGAGIGWADLQIVLAAAQAGARVHTSDRGVCKALGLALPVFSRSTVKPAAGPIMVNTANCGNETGASPGHHLLVARLDEAVRLVLRLADEHELGRDGEAVAREACGIENGR